jgi:hypothetical protein
LFSSVSIICTTTAESVTKSIDSSSTELLIISAPRVTNAKPKKAVNNHDFDIFNPMSTASTEKIDKSTIWNSNEKKLPINNPRIYTGVTKAKGKVQKGTIKKFYLLNFN